MRNNDIEKRIRRAFAHAAPDDFGAILSDCGQTKGRIIHMEETRKKYSWIKRGAVVAAAVVLLVGGVLGARMYTANRAVDSVISLDVNPSIEIDVNRKERVLKVNALNEEGQAVIGDMDLAGSDLEVAVNALVGSMLRNGYISDLSNSILVSVDNDDADRGSALQAKLAASIDDLMQTDNFLGAVISQTVDKDDELTQLAEQYGITPGKAQLIRQLTTQNTMLQFEDLARLSINELNLLSESGNIHLENVQATGTASDKAYIGEAKAKAAALAHAHVKEADILRYRWELDREDGVMVYEIRFDHAGFEYEYDINALTGAVVKSEKEKDDDADASGSTAYIGMDKAKETALGHAGVKAENAQKLRCERDHDDGVTVYEIEFVADGSKFDYELDAGTGKVLKHSKKALTASVAPSAGATSAYIGETKAKEAAINHAGVKTGGVTEYECELDRENGMPVYNVEFHANGFEFEYDIHAEKGTVVSFSKEADDDRSATGSTTAVGSTYIGETKAKETALNHAGVKADAIRNYSCELDEEDGRLVYEIRFEANGYEYDYEIHAQNGGVVKSEKDKND